MRKFFYISVLAAINLCPITQAHAFGLLKHQAHKKTEKTNVLTPAIQSPGEVSNADAAPKPDKPAQPSPPATKAERESAKSFDLVSQSTFWMAELSKNPKDEEAAIYASGALYGIGSYPRSIEVAAIGIQSNENSAKLWAQMGLALMGTGQNSDAIQALSRASSLNNQDASIKNALGVAYDGIDRSDLAIATYNDALKLSPNDSKILTNLGLSLALSGNLPLAESTLRQAASNPIAPIQARQNLALILALQGKFTESEKVASQDLPAAIAQENMKYVKSMLNGESQNRWNVSQN